MNERINNIIEKFKIVTQKECYKIDIIDEMPKIYENKIGGKPYLPKRYGLPKITKILNKQGIKVSQKRVTRRMKVLKLRSITVKKLTIMETKK